MPVADKPLEHWYVAFHSSSRDALITRILRPGFQHCLAFAPDGDSWIVVDPALETIYVRIISNAHAARMMAELKLRGATILLAEAMYDRNPFPRVVLASCVTIVAELLGVRRVCALTPYRLYRTLQALGAVTVMEPDDGKSIGVGPEDTSAPGRSGSCAPASGSRGES